ncbi:two-component regulator propeller domain-containing protein [Sinomicrobium sp. M5D2P17]
MRRIFHLIFPLFFLPLTTASQNDVYTFRHLSTADGLSQSSVIAIKQDGSGQMWFGTRDGLNKYDGTSFSVYRNDPEDPLSISNSDILSLEEDRSGYVWVGTYNGLNRYDPRKDIFRRYFHTNSPHSLSNNMVLGIRELKNGEIWIGTANGLSIYDPEEDSFISVSHTQGEPRSLPGNFVSAILETTNGDVWVGTSRGMCKVLRREGNLFYFKSYRASDGSELFIRDMAESPDGDIWIGTKDHGLYKLYTATGEIKLFSGDGAEEKIDEDVRTLTLDKDGVLWAGTYNGINTIAPDGTVRKILNQQGNISGLSRNTVKSVYTDKKGSVWIGAYYGGINIWDKANVNFTNYRRTTEPNTLGYDVVSSIEADRHGNLYFGTEGGGITVKNNESGKADYIQVNNGLPGNNIKSMYLTGKEQLWIGTFNAGITVYDTRSKTFADGILSRSLRNFLDQAGVYAIGQSDTNTFWLGTFGEGLVRYDSKNKTFFVLRHDPEDLNSISNDQVRTILADSVDTVWVGTPSGLNRLVFDKNNPDKPRIKHFFYDAETLSGDDILTVFKDSKRNLWVGTKSRGLFRRDGDTFTNEQLHTDNQSITAIHAIVEDEEGYLWISSNQGIVKYNPVARKTKLYNQKDGLVSNEFNDNACLKLASGKMYFGGPMGVSSFDPAKIAVNSYTPGVILTDFKVRNESVYKRKEGEILDKSINHTKALTLNYDKANFSIHFAIPNFINATNNQYAYRLIGLDDQWNITSATEASYTIQKPGTYRFEVKGANNDGVWNEIPTVLEITVRPAPWRSWWAFTLYALLIMLALYGLIRIMKSKARLRHELELEHLERERVKEINRAKLQFFTNISHEFRTPLTLILGPLQQLLSDYKGSNKMYKKLLVIESSANHLLQLINRLMDFRKLENERFKLQSAEGNMVKFLREIYLSFTEYAKAGNYTYTFDTTDEEIPVYYDRDKLEHVFYNLISNAFRYTSNGGQIKLEVRKGTKNIIVEVKDSGVGIPEAYIDKIFDRFFEVGMQGKPENYNKGTGIGLSLAKSNVELHKGNITVKNRKSGGAVFKVKLPLGKEHLSGEEILTDFKFSDDISLYTGQPEKIEWTEEQEVHDLLTDELKNTVMIVEDNTALRSFIVNLLRKDYNVIEAENGKVALKKALKYIPDLIVSDVIMPEMVGTELCSNLKENLKTSHIPIILLTSRTSLVYKFEGLESGADDYISKPFNVKEFFLRIRNLLESTQRLKKKFSSEDHLSPAEITVSSIDEQLLKKALQIVEDNISDEQFDIPAFCTELGVSRTMLFTKIKAWTNFTPNEFIREIRLKRAAQLLEQDKLNISQVGYKVGFRNPKYFARCFRKKYGLTPTEYIDKFSADYV